jgi:hypothetical protein
MTDAGAINLDTSALMEKQGRGCPRGSKNKPKDTSLVASSSASAKRHPGRPLGSKNKPKASAAVAPGASAAPRKPLLLLLSRFTLSYVSLVLNAVSSSMFR